MTIGSSSSPQDISIRKVAVFRALQLGDLLVSVPAFRALRRGFPDDEITLIGLPWASSLADRFSHYIDRFVEFPGYGDLVEAPHSEATEDFLSEQRSYGYDLAIQLHGSGVVSNEVICALGARRTAGYFEDEAQGDLDVALPYADHLSEICRNLRLVEAVGGRPKGTDLEFPLSQEERSEAGRLLAGVGQRGRPLVGLHPGSRSPARRWPPECFATVADTLIDQWGAEVVITGSDEEAEIAGSVAALMSSEPVLLAGKSSLGGLAAVIDRLDLFISNDTGPAHLAVASGTPSVTLFGPADPVRWAPLDQTLHPIARLAVECSPCAFWECPIDHRCLRWIGPEVVLTLCERLLSRGAAA